MKWKIGEETGDEKGEGREWYDTKRDKIEKDENEGCALNT